MTSLGRGGIRFHGALPFRIGGIGGGGSAIAERVTRGGSTMGKPSISRALTLDDFGDDKTCPPLICDAPDLTFGGIDEAAEG